MARGTVHVIDDDDAIRTLIADLIRSVGLSALEYPSAEAFLAGCDGQRPGCIVLDLILPGMSGMDALPRLRDRGLVLPVIMLTGYGNVALAVASLKAGAADFFEKPFNALDLVQRIVALVEADRANFRTAELAAAGAARLEPLSQRERQVLELIAQGHTSKDIGRMLRISSRTVDAHRASILRKAAAQSIAELVQLWMAARNPSGGSSR